MKIFLFVVSAIIGAILPLNVLAMNKSELIHYIAGSADISTEDAERAVDGFVEAVTEALKARESVSLIGFGTFSVKERAARMGRNPQTGQNIEIPASATPSFKAGKALRDAVNEHRSR